MSTPMRPGAGGPNHLKITIGSTAASRQTSKLVPAAPGTKVAPRKTDGTSCVDETKRLKDKIEKTKGKIAEQLEALVGTTGFKNHIQLQAQEKQLVILKDQCAFKRKFDLCHAKEAEISVNHVNKEFEQYIMDDNDQAKSKEHMGAKIDGLTSAWERKLVKDLKAARGEDKQPEHEGHDDTDGSRTVLGDVQEEGM